MAQIGKPSRPDCRHRVRPEGSTVHVIISQPELRWTFPDEFRALSMSHAFFGPKTRLEQAHLFTFVYNHQRQSKVLKTSDRTFRYLYDPHHWLELLKSTPGHMKL